MHFDCEKLYLWPENGTWGLNRFPGLGLKMYLRCGIYLMITLLKIPRQRVSERIFFIKIINI